MWHTSLRPCMVLFSVACGPAGLDELTPPEKPARPESDHDAEDTEDTEDPMVSDTGLEEDSVLGLGDVAWWSEEGG